MSPIIGLTTYLQRAQTGVWDVTASFLSESYLSAITRAGGIAVLLPPQSIGGGAAAAVLDRLDGLLVVGGRDVDPARYGQPPHPETDSPSPLRDEWEEALLLGAIDRGLPFLAICRGLQLLNVALGGTLVQHLDDVLDGSRYRLGGGVFASNAIVPEPDSRLGALVGVDPLRVKSYHHQAVDRLGDGVRVTARSDDGLVQAIELDGVPFGLAVQWHPEEDAAADARLFAGLVEAARGYRKARA